MGIYLAVLLAGCSTVSPIDTSRPPPADWPALKESILTVPAGEVKKSCPATATGYDLRSCALIYFADRRCTILLTDGTDHVAEILEHERLHCRGYDHPGESSFRDGWERYKARGR